MTNTNIYTSSVKQQQNKINNNETINKKILTFKSKYQSTILENAHEHMRELKERVLTKGKLEELQLQASCSNKTQEKLEEHDAGSDFVKFYEHYQSQACDILRDKQ